jgi:hypothetical protein
VRQLESTFTLSKQKSTPPQRPKRRSFSAARDNNAPDQGSTPGARIKVLPLPIIRHVNLHPDTPSGIFIDLCSCNPVPGIYVRMNIPAKNKKGKHRKEETGTMDKTRKSEKLYC